MAIIKNIEIKVNEQGTAEAKVKMDGLNQSTKTNTQSVNQNEQAQKALKTQLREAIEEVQKLSDQYGVSSKQAVEAAKRAADLKDRIEDANDAMLAFKGEGTFIATSKALSSVTSGLGAVEGAMNLVGNESEDVQKALLKVQSLMALSQGLEGLEDAGRSFNQLKIAIANTTVVQRLNNTATAIATTLQKAFTGAVNTTSVGFKGLKLAIAGTGIGLLLVGVGALIQNFDKIKAVILNVVPGLKAVGETITGIVNRITDFIGVTSKVGRELDKQKEYAEKALKQNEKYLKANEHKLTESQKREIELNNEHFERVVSGEFTKEQSLKILREKTAKERKEKLDEQNRIELEKQKELQEKRKAKLEEQRQKEIEIANKKIEDEKQRQESILNINQDYAKKLEDLEADTELKKIELEKSRAIAELDRLKSNEEQKKNIILYYDKLTQDELDKQKSEQFEKDLEAKSKEAENDQLSFEERLAKLQEREDLIRANKNLSFKEEQRLIEENREKTAKIEAEQANADKINNDLKLELTQDTFGKITQILKQNSGVGKAFATGQALINTYQGVTQVLSNPTTLPEPFGTINKIASTVLTLKTGFDAVKNINSVQTLGGGGGGVGGGSTPAPPSFNLVQGTGTNQISESLQKQNQPIKAYVVSSEVTTQQALDRNIKETASI